VDVDTEVEAEVAAAEAVDVTVTVDVLWIVVSDTLPAFVPLPVSAVAAPMGDNSTGVAPAEEGALALKG
jgi:hypothetical protein